MIVLRPNDWANVVRDRRIELGLTQADLAERIGKARQWVVRFESGHARSASVESLMAVLAGLGLSAAVEVDENAFSLPGDEYDYDLDDTDGTTMGPRRGSPPRRGTE